MTDTDIRTSVTARLAEDLDAGFVGLFDGYRHVVFSTALRVRPWLLTILTNL